MRLRIAYLDTRDAWALAIDGGERSTRGNSLQRCGVCNSVGRNLAEREIRTS